MTTEPMGWGKSQAEAGEARIGGGYVDTIGIYNFEVTHVWDSGQAPEGHKDLEAAKHPERHDRYIGMRVRCIDKGSAQKDNSMIFRIRTGLSLKKMFPYQESASKAFRALGLQAEQGSDFHRDSPIGVVEFIEARFKAKVTEQQGGNKDKNGKPYLQLSQFDIESVDEEYNTGGLVRELRVANDEDIAISVQHYADEAERAAAKGESTTGAAPDDDDIPF